MSRKSKIAGYSKSRAHLIFEKAYPLKINIDS